MKKIMLQVSKIVYPHIKSGFLMLKVALTCVNYIVQDIVYDSSSSNGHKGDLPYDVFTDHPTVPYFKNMFGKPDISSLENIPESWFLRVTYIP